jgi:hypothetical protein
MPEWMARAHIRGRGGRRSSIPKEDQEHYLFHMLRWRVYVGMDRKPRYYLIRWASEKGTWVGIYTDEVARRLRYA